MSFNVRVAMMGLVAVLFTMPVSAGVGEEVPQRAMCFIKMHAPKLIVGQLPFSCDGKARLFEAEVIRVASSLEQRDKFSGIQSCNQRIRQPRHLIVVAETVWNVRDQQGLSSSEAIAKGVVAACESMGPAPKPETPNGRPDYLHWTLDVNGYPPGECTKTNLARTFEDAKTWFKKSEGERNLLGFDEHEDKIIFLYYDSTLRMKVARTFYRSAAECRLYRP